MINALNAKIIRVRSRGSICITIVRGRGLGGILGYLEGENHETSKNLE